jgi:hypothetical protein
MAPGRPSLIESANLSCAFLSRASDQSGLSIPPQMPQPGIFIPSVIAGLTGGLFGYATGIIAGVQDYWMKEDSSPFNDVSSGVNVSGFFFFFSRFTCPQGFGLIMSK